MGKFWFVWSESGGAPCVKHDTQEKALEEAQRLSKDMPRHKFYVLESKICVEVVVSL
jgi:hypothetical protein